MCSGEWNCGTDTLGNWLNPKGGLRLEEGVSGCVVLPSGEGAMAVIAQIINEQSIVRSLGFRPKVSPASVSSQPQASRSQHLDATEDVQWQNS
eukprot:2230215-Rhodomonas_salina.1